ncbi:sigma-70 family RNA polymerase sigma factor [Paludibaculum fermentans]|uniref:sigma-70 family RNA polymerase sigma factor n=1 Tax=Paludibaculum fermentans TaxID=1473598 RepID=UPI003EBBDBE3
MDESEWPPEPVETDVSPAFAVGTGPAQQRELVWREWLRQAAEGDRDAFARLYDATSGLIYSLVLRILGNPADAEEVTLDVYVQAWRHASRFDSARGGVTAWLATMGRSRALDRYRSHGARQQREAGPALEESVSEAPSPERLVSMGEDRKVIAAALKALPAEQRQVIELAYFQGLSQSEMAERLDLPLGTVKTRVRLGMMCLRESILEQRG